MRPLSEKQKAALAALAEAGPAGRGSYPGHTLGTMRSLRTRGLAGCHMGLGSMAMPRSSIKWYLTPAGRGEFK